MDQHTQQTPSMSKSLKLHCNVVLVFSNRWRMLYVLTHQKTCFASVFLNVAMSTSEMLCVWIHQKTCLAHGSLNVIPSTSQSGEVAYQKKQIVPRISFLTFGIKCLLLEYTSRENYNFFVPNTTRAIFFKEILPGVFVQFFQRSRIGRTIFGSKNTAKQLFCLFCCGGEIEQRLRGEFLKKRLL